MYTILYRDRLKPADLSSPPNHWDLFISSYNESARVQGAFRSVLADAKYWIVHPEYGYSEKDLPADEQIIRVDDDDATEAKFVRECLDQLGDISELRVCVDITGFMRHTLVSMVRELMLRCPQKFWMVYSDPGRYVSDELTRFSGSGVKEVRPVAGFSGTHDISTTEHDRLILGTGYDEGMMRAVVEHKRRAARTELFGLPSLQPSMYQENVLSVAGLDESPGRKERHDVIFSAANDPFGTAQALHEHVQSLKQSGRLTNLYLAPTGSKAQVLGFALFYVSQCSASPTSLILPLPHAYERETSAGYERSWLYEIDVGFLSGLQNYSF